MNILVTGGAGFIGSHFIRHLLKSHNHRVFNLDNLSYAGDLARLKDVEKNSRYHFIKGDIRNIENIEGVFSHDIDTVVHLAAESIPEDVYVPVQSVPKIGTRTITFGELWKEQSKNNKPIKNEKGEAIFLRGKQTKILSFLNGGQWMPVKAITRHRYKGKIIKLIQKQGVIKATPNHSIYSSSLELTNPHTNPELLVIREINEIKKRNKRKSLALLEILAAYITEGNATFNKANGGYIIEINQTNKGWIEHIGELIRKEFSLKFYIGKHKNKQHKDVFYLQVSNKKFFNYLIKNCGKYCDGKFFPDWIFDLESNQRSFFWSKLLEGDGTKDGRYSTTSYKLTNQISLLLTLQGKKFKVFEYDRKNYKRSWEFKTELSGQHYGLVKRKKQEIQYEGWVYDLEVEKSHNFVCGIGNVVCHNTHVDNSIKDPFVFEAVNVRGTLNLLACARKHKVTRFIHISTDEVYGEIEEGKFTEDSHLAPNSPYSASKAAGDFFVRSYIRTFDFPAIIIRPSNNYGPWQYPEKFIPVAISSVLADKKIPVYAQGLNCREWLYVTDCVKGIALIMDKGKVGEVYNLGSNIERRNIDLAKEILKILNKPDDFINFVADRPGHDFRYCLDSAKVNNLGWSPEVGFEIGITATVEWYKNKRTWTEGKLSR